MKRGLFPFGFIESNIFRTEDIKDISNYFLDSFTFNADEIFSYSQVMTRDQILFNHIPQIEWMMVKDRTFGRTKLEDEIDEYYNTIEIIEERLGINVDYGLVSTYRLFNLIKYFLLNFSKNTNKKKIFGHILSQMKKKNTFFTLDYLLTKIIFNKLKNKNKEMEDLLFKEIISQSIKEN